VSNQHPVKKKTQQKQSFSLFAQLDAASWGASRITMDDLETATTPEERLSMLQKVAHVDDVVMDWKEVSPLLQEGLSIPDLSADFIQLHRKWFDQGRASNEHFPIRCDLCDNILLSILKFVVNNWGSEHQIQQERISPAQETLFDLWSLWNDMWCDLMKQPTSCEDLKGSSLETMGQQVLLLLRNLETPNEESQSFALYPSHILALVDPSARWFSCWAARMAPPQLVRLLRTAEVLPDLWQRISSSQEFLFLDQCKTLPELLGAALRQSSLSLWKSILVCTRVHWLPVSFVWASDTSPRLSTPLTIERLMLAYEAMAKHMDKAEEETLHQMLSSAAGTSSAQLVQQFEIFMNVGVLSMTGSNQENRYVLGSVCAEAIETLLWGAMPKLGSSERECCFEAFPTIWKKCQEYIPQEETAIDSQSFDGLLSSIVGRIGRSLPSDKLILS
jgi:hypothetical protein